MSGKDRSISDTMTEPGPPTPEPGPPTPEPGPPTPEPDTERGRSGGGMSPPDLLLGAAAGDCSCCMGEDCGRGWARSEEGSSCPAPVAEEVREQREARQGVEQGEDMAAALDTIGKSSNLQDGGGGATLPVRLLTLFQSFVGMGRV